MSQQIELDGHRLLARCAPERDTAARALLDKLTALHRAGPALKPGSHVDFGWSVLQIEAHPDHWVVCEPDYGSDPLQWKPEVDDTLRVMQQQAALHDVLGNVPSERTRGDQWLLVQPDAVIAPESYLHRSAVSGQDSGWYIGVENAPEGTTATPGKPMLAGLLIDIKPAWLSVLALPVGYLAHFVGDQLATIYDTEHNRVFPPEGEANK